MKYSAALSLYKKACKKASDLKPEKVKESDCIQDSGGSWKMITVFNDRRPGERVLVGIVSNGKCKVGRELAGYLARQQRMGMDAQNWAKNTLPGLCKSAGVTPPTPIPPQKPIPRPNMQQGQAPGKPKSVFDRK